MERSSTNGCLLLDPCDHSHQPQEGAVKEIVPQTEGFTEFPRPLHTYTDLKRLLNELNGPKRPPNKEGCMLPTMPLGNLGGEFPEIPNRISMFKIFQAHPDTSKHQSNVTRPGTRLEALVLVGNKWTADALSEIGVSTQGGNSIERERPQYQWEFRILKWRYCTI